MRQSKIAWRLGFIFPEVYEQDPQFRDYLARLIRSGLRFASSIAITISLFYVIVFTLFLGKDIALFPKFGEDLIMPLIDKLIISFLGIICLIVSCFRKVLYWGRAIVFISILGVCVASTWTDFARGNISFSVGYLMLALLVGSGLVPFRAWQVLLLGIIITASFQLSIRLFAVPLGIETFNIEGESIVLLAASTLLGSIITGLIYRSRYLLFKARQKQISLRQEVADYAHELEEANLKIRETQDQLIQSEKMASLGDLVAGVAHEVNTPLGAIHSNADTAQRAVKIIKNFLENSQESLDADKLESRAKKAIALFTDLNESTTTAAHRIDKIIKALRGFACLDEAEFQTFDLNRGLEDTITLLSIDADSEVEIVSEFNPLPEISCIAAHLNQVFMKILTNALEAMGKQGKITIKTGVEKNWIVIQFKDTGKGISKENLKHIFDPGFTTKGVRVGTGLGLSICYRTIMDHEGRIDVESEEGKGTTVIIRLPLLEHIAADDIPSS